MVLNLAAIRREYAKQRLSPRSCLANPLAQLEKWLHEAVHAQVFDPTAMILATASGSGMPSARVVLLKGIEQGKLIWFTNYMSRKGQDIAEYPYAALVFFWPEMERQIRVEGSVDKLPESASDAYFASRPYRSRLGAWASDQSAVITSKSALLKQVVRYGMRYPVAIPRPPNWGGYQLTAMRVEFWQGRPSRLHDRVCYTQHATDGWKKVRLAP
ncbi:MAG: pyridoxamine 5'-phosphate oxidase [Neisseriales bacterium]|nr:MAG: pyridoxamine 5'-phosphate oxidase [Neisseriales bacterium]